MPNVAYQAEAAVLGALLNDRRLLGGLPYLTAGDFADARHQALFDAITSTRIAHPDATVPRLYVLVARAAQHPGITPVSLGRLADSSPEPEHAASYGRIVQEASLRRALAGHASRLARDTAALIAVRGADQTPDPALGHLARLATALRKHTETFDPPFRADASGAPARDGPLDLRVRREEQVLAGLLQHFPQASRVTRWLPPGAFAPGIRRDVYHAIRELGARGEPVSNIAVAWEVGSRQALDRALEGQAPAMEPARPQDNLAYLARLDGIPARAATTISAGRNLLADHLRSQITAGQPGPPAGLPARPQPGPAGGPASGPRSSPAADDQQLRLLPPAPGSTVNGHRPRP